MVREFLSNNLCKFASETGKGCSDITLPEEQEEEEEEEKEEEEEEEEREEKEQYFPIPFS